MGSYPDDIIRAGTPEFHELCQKTQRQFEANGDQDPPFTFAGLNVSPCANHAYTIDQKFYIPKIEELDNSTEFAEYRSMRMKLAWLANSRPDMQFEISQLAQITQNVFENEPKKHVKRLNSLVRHAHNIVAHLKFPDLDRNSLRLVGYSDAAYANNHDLSSQLGRIVLLMDDADRFSPISFKSYKSRRVVRSVLAAEVIAFADLFDDAYALRSQFEHALGRSIPMQLMTDS